MCLQCRHCWLTNIGRCPLASQHYLNFGQNGHHGHDDAENEVEADEDLVLRAVIGPGVKDVEEHNSSESQDVVDNGDKQQSCKGNIGKEIRIFFVQIKKVTTISPLYVIILHRGSKVIIINYKSVAAKDVKYAPLLPSKTQALPFLQDVSCIFSGCVDCLPANQHLVFPSSALCNQDWFQEWAKSISRISWMMMKMKEPTTPK